MAQSPKDPFYSKRSFLKRFSLTILGLSFLALLGNCGGGAAPGGINLPAPTADIEAGPPAAVPICDTIPDAPSGSFVKITNTTHPSDPVIQANLDANNSFSVTVCVQPGDTLNLQLFDQNGNSSAVQTITRTGNEPAGVCPNPTNQPPTCP